MSEDEKRERTAPRPLGLLEVLRRVHDGRLTVDEAVRILSRPDPSAREEPRS